MITDPVHNRVGVHNDTTLSFQGLFPSRDEGGSIRFPLHVLALADGTVALLQRRGLDLYRLPPAETAYRLAERIPGRYRGLAEAEDGDILTIQAVSGAPHVRLESFLLVSPSLHPSIIIPSLYPTFLPPFIILSLHPTFLPPFIISSLHPTFLPPFITLSVHPTFLPQFHHSVLTSDLTSTFHHTVLISDLPSTFHQSVRTSDLLDFHHSVPTSDLPFSFHNRVPLAHKLRNITVKIIKIFA